ncbi:MULTISPECIES: hypothetical protein [unclassified Ruminococcus]|uniref:hypothetical protein n=1 Tax=unclassified Ruminococcus TaxID=2608920 RepID=UPI001113B0D9|nr:MULTISPECIES: hypothetical protein [unclassified Ruminococcus]
MVYKRIISIVLALVIGAVMCGCSEETLRARSVDEIKDYLVQNDYYNEKTFAVNSTQDFSSFGGVMNNDWTIFFFDYGEDQEAADKMIELMLSGITLTNEEHKANYVIYEYDSDPNYTLFVRINNTFLQVYGPKESKKQIRELAENLGYYK